MKKHEKLLRAMQDYPAGTKFKDTYNGKEYVSSGVFELAHDVGFEGDVIESKSQSFVYEANKDQWAEVVKPTFDFSVNLSGKLIGRAVHTKKPEGNVVIHTTNEREFKVLMKHYSEKGWRIKPYNNNYPYVIYKSNCVRLSGPFPAFDIVPFEEFAKSVGIEVPKVIIKSEDGVDLYEGDDCWICIKDNEWYFDTHSDGGDDTMFSVANNGEFVRKEGERYFSTKEAAEAWIKKQNRGIIIAEGPGYIVKVTEAGARITAKGDVTLSLEEIEHIYEVIKGVKR